MMESMAVKRAPKWSGAAGRAFWHDTLAVYDLNPAELVILARACRTLDVLDRLDETLAGAADLVVEGSTGQPKPHPALAAAADQQRLLDQLIRSLNLPLDGELAGRRRSPAAKAAAQARWRDRRSG